MNERDSDGAFADGGGHPFDIATSHIAGREDPRLTRFEQMRRPGQRPLRLCEIVACEIGTGLDESLLVERETAREPARVRHGAGHHEYLLNRVRLDLAGALVAPAE